MLDKKLLEILACPKCKGELEYQADSQDADRGKLICRRCKLVYLVERDIPNMVVEQAGTLKDDAAASVQVF
ncbi:MAG: Trm112 family protein [Calditrichaceae bacterium]|nr:Trm112 family protein [Calditrichia bacterium]NUQ40900.1 Trm112 family protein [Calditrichaceae bacterium]